MPDKIIDEFASAAKVALRYFEGMPHEDKEELIQLVRGNLEHDCRCYSKWHESCDLVLEALYNFNYELGFLSEEILKDESRLKISHLSPGKSMGICHPANCETNDKDYAVIDFYSDGTINDAVYLAHELGHLISDDYLQTHGESYQSVGKHISEIQAFYFQHLIYEHLSKSSDKKYSDFLKAHKAIEITRSVFDIPVGIGSLMVENSIHLNTGVEEGLSTFQSLMKDWFGSLWPIIDENMQITDSIMVSNSRDNYISALHTHSMASLISSGLFLKAKSESSTTRITDILLGKNKTHRDIANIMECSNICALKDLQFFAQSSINYAISPFLATNIAKRYHHPYLHLGRMEI